MGAESGIAYSDNIRYQNSSTNVIATSLGLLPILLDMQSPTGASIRRAREAIGWSQRQLADKAGVSQPAIEKIESGKTKKSRFLPDVLKALENSAPGSPAAQAELRSMPEPTRYGIENFAIYAGAEAGSGHIIVEQGPYDWGPRPTFVRNLKDAYGVLIRGESMLPVYKPGTVVVVAKNEPLIAGEDYVFYSEQDGEGRAMIKTLRSYTDAAWTLQQWNPSKTFNTSRREWRWAHRVLGNYSRR